MYNRVVLNFIFFMKILLSWEYVQVDEISPPKKILRNFMAKTKKCEKKWPFLGNFLCKIGQILKLMARVTGCSKNPEIFFGCSSYIYTAMDKLPG